MKKKLLNTFRSFLKIKSLERILAEKTIGKPYGTFLTKIPPNHYQYKNKSYRNVNRNGINYSLDISDIMAWYIYFGFKEESKTRLYKLVKQNNYIIDVGANIGETTLNFAKIIGDSGKVFSFEPDPINFSSLTHNVSLNKFNNITLNPVGLGDEKGSFKIHTIDENNKGMNRIVSNTTDINEYREINVTTLDNYYKENNLTKIDLIKIDVEGFEYNVLKGAKNLLIEFKPKLFIELDDDNLREQNSNANQLITYLSNLGYEINNAETTQKISHNDDFTNCHFDIIATANNV